MNRKKAASVLSVIVLLVASGFAIAGVSYSDPAGGWAYSYTGDGAAAGSGAWNSAASDADAFDALDGTWGHTNDSDLWDGTYSSSTGGLKSENGYLTIADRVGTSGAANSKLYLAHDISSEGGASSTVIDDGVTLSFRTRLTPEFNDGAEIRSSGHGMFGINQKKYHAAVPDVWSNDNAGEKIGFSLIKASDYSTSRFPDPATRKSGLVMNNLVPGGVPSKGVDTDDPQAPAGLNVLQMEESTLTDWHEFWITIAADTSGGGTHRVGIYMDGSLIENVFHVTASIGLNDYPSFDPGQPGAGTVWRNYLAMGNCRTGQNAAFDVDFFSWKSGVHAPVPEPAAAGLLGLGGLLLLKRRRR